MPGLSCGLLLSSVAVDLLLYLYLQRRIASRIFARNEVTLDGEHREQEQEGGGEQSRGVGGCRIPMVMPILCLHTRSRATERQSRDNRAEPTSAHVWHDVILINCSLWLIVFAR